MPPRVGLIVASTRAVRIGPQIADFVLQTIRKDRVQDTASNDTTIGKIDLAKWKLPLFDEPVIPMSVKDSSGYHHEHTRAWSREIASYEGFIFVSPQYNWGYPAGLKNAIDYLFNEWTGKPAMIVTYGGHGGGQCGEQLSAVLTGCRMTVIPTRVELKYPDMQWAAEKAFPGGDLGLDAESDGSVWAEDRPKIVSVFGELQAALKEKDMKNGDNA